jgi:hypothetical protein
MKKVEVIETCQKYIKEKDASRIGSGPMEQRILHKKRANEIWETIPKRSLKYVPDYVWQYILTF